MSEGGQRGLDPTGFDNGVVIQQFYDGASGCVNPGVGRRTKTTGPSQSHYPNAGESGRRATDDRIWRTIIDHDDFGLRRRMGLHRPQTSVQQVRSPTTGNDDG
jgi:hypothetical protein